MKSVLIVGGGPAGLVAAKTLKRWKGTPFKVTLFEAAERVGGMWRGKKGEQGDKCSPEMRTNLSRFTVAFPDLPWQSVPVETDEGYSTSSVPPMFPKAYQVGAYLEEYAKRFIDAGTVHYHTKVISAKLEGTPPRWTVVSLNTESHVKQSETFDYLIVASGFFSRAARISHETSNKLGSAKVQHSANFRHVSSFGDQAGNVVVIGGGISGSEAAATAAFQISNATYAPGKQKSSWSESKVYHVFDRPFYVLPRYVSPEPYDNDKQRFNPAPNFRPVDLNLYDLSRRGNAEITAALGLTPRDRAPKTHEFLRSMLGGDNSQFGPRQLVYDDEQTQYPAYTGIADTYAEFVRSGLIVPVRGRAAIKSDSTGSITIDVSQEGTWSSQFPMTENQPSSITDVTGIIEATGYEVNVDYLHDEIKNALEFDPTCDRVPFLLQKGSISSTAIPELAFLGFYEGPYWGVMEMQARLIAQRWVKSEQDLDQDLSIPAKIREGIRSRDLSVPQFWMADYVGLVEEFSREAGCRRNDGCFDGQTGPLFPARYTGQGSDLNGAEQTVREIRDLLDDSENEIRFVAAAAFRAMQGQWQMHRKITSRNPSAPGGILEGTANFHPREPTAPHFSAEYLYIEEGTFTMDNGYAFTAKRRYIYRYSEAKDAITAWFVQEDGETAERFFNELMFERPPTEEQGWIAKGKHWCEPDMYKSFCEFVFKGCDLEHLGITYEVKGPNKDYTHESWYKRAPR